MTTESSQLKAHVVVIQCPCGLKHKFGPALQFGTSICRCGRYLWPASLAGQPSPKEKKLP